MRRFLKDWNRFWFEPQGVQVMGAFRLLVGLYVIYNFALSAGMADLLYSDNGILTLKTLKATLGRPHNTLLSFVDSAAGMKALLALLFVTAAAFAAGLATRASTIVLYVLVASFHERNILVLNSADSTLRCLLFFFIFSPAGRAYSLDNLIRRRRRPTGPDLPRTAAPWAQRMMQIQVAVIYFFAAYYKIRGSTWDNGSAMYYISGLVDFTAPGVERIMAHPLLYTALTYATVVTEIAFPFLLFFRQTRPYAILFALGLQGWIYVFMVLPDFPVIMTLACLPFLTEREWRWLTGTVKAAAARMAALGGAMRMRRLAR